MRLFVKVVPRASRDRVVGWQGDAVKVCVAAAPERGRANEAVIAILAAALGVPRASVRIISGAGSPRKMIEINGVDEEEARRRLPS